MYSDVEQIIELEERVSGGVGLFQELEYRIELTYRCQRVARNSDDSVKSSNGGFRVEKSWSLFGTKTRLYKPDFNMCLLSSLRHADRAGELAKRFRDKEREMTVLKYQLLGHALLQQQDEALELLDALWHCDSKDWHRDLRKFLEDLKVDPDLKYLSTPIQKHSQRLAKFGF